MKTPKRKFGDWGEKKASIFLQKKNYQIIARNYEIKRGGKRKTELDIIAWHKKPHHGNTLCFIEVKTRTAPEHEASAERATDAKKITHLLRAAKLYCLEKNIDIERTPIQFEQISIYFDPNKKDVPPKIKHYVIPID